MKVTQWFEPDVKPVHVGVYQTQHYFAGWLRGANWLWNGEAWAYEDGEPSSDQYRRWRGLTEKQDGA